MKEVKTISGVAAPFLMPNIDTDVIVRIERLVALKPGEFGPYAFESLRYNADGTENADFILNHDRYRNAPILVAGRNFGCGSSREAAVWAVWDYGIRCIIAPGFGEIFRNNCLQYGLLPIVLPEATVSKIATAIQSGAQHAGLDIDLEACTVTLPGMFTVSFQIDDRSRKALLTGADPIEMTLRDEHVIAAFQTKDKQCRPWIYAI